MSAPCKSEGSERSMSGVRVLISFPMCRLAWNAPVLRSPESHGQQSQAGVCAGDSRAKS